MKSANGAAAVSLLACAAAIAFRTTADADPAAGPNPSAAQPAGPNPSVAQPAGPNPSAAQPAGPNPSAAQPAGPNPSAAQPGTTLAGQGTKPTESEKLHKPLSYYEFNTPQRVWRYDRDEDTCKSEERHLNAPRGTRFIIVRTIGSETKPQIVIRVCKDDWRGELIGSCGLDPDTPPPQGEAQNDRYIDRKHAQFDKYYCFDKKDFDRLNTDGYIDEKYIRAQLDPVYGLNFTLPIKIRRAIPGFNTTLDRDIQIGGFFGARWRISDSSDYYVDLPVVSAGLTTLTIAKGTAPSAMDSSKETMGIAAGAGFIIELSEFQLGIMTGFDRAPGEVGKDWRYNGKLWYSFSVGYSFLKSK